MANKELQTRIALKYDTYANWTDESKASVGANLVLLKGEIGICAIETKAQGAQTAPTTLFKVGDGTSPFKSLKWASALAADVYSWAKASDVVLENKTITFVGTGKTISIPYITEAEVKAITDPLAQRVANIEDKFKGDTSIETQITGLDNRLDTIEGSGEGSIAKALADAKAYTDTREDVLEKYADAAAATALSNAKEYVDGTGGVKPALAAHESNKDNPHGVTAAQVGLGNVDNKSVATIKTEFTGSVADSDTGFVTGGAVHSAIASAQQSTEAKITALTAADGPVTANTANIAKNAKAIEDEAKERGDVDKDLDDRLKKVEAFFAVTDGQTIDDALDTLVEIQDYLDGDGSATGGLIDRVSALEGEFETSGRVSSAESNINTLTELTAEHTTSIETLESITKSFLSKGEDAISTAISTAKGAADAAQGTADDAIEILNGTNSNGLVSKVNALDETINGKGEGTGHVNGLVDDLDDLAQEFAAVKAAVGSNNSGLVKDVAGLITTVGDSNSGLVKDVTALKAIVSTGDDSNASLRSAITTLSDTVTHSTTGLAATKAIADGAASQAETNRQNIANIQANYVQVSGTSLMLGTDVIIFNCGTSEV